MFLEVETKNCQKWMMATLWKSAVLLSDLIRVKEQQIKIERSVMMMQFKIFFCLHDIIACCCKQKRALPVKKNYLENFLHPTENMLMKTTVKNRSANSEMSTFCQRPIFTFWMSWNVDLDQGIHKVNIECGVGWTIFHGGFHEHVFGQVQEIF